MLCKKANKSARRNTAKCVRTQLPLYSRLRAKSMHSKLFGCGKIKFGATMIPSLEFRILPIMHHTIRAEITRINNYAYTKIMPTLCAILVDMNLFGPLSFSKEALIGTDNKSTIMTAVAKYAADIDTKVKEIGYNDSIFTAKFQLPIIASAILDRAKFRVGSADIVVIYAEAIFKLQAEYAVLTRMRNLVLTGPGSSPSVGPGGGPGSVILIFLDNTIQSLRELILSIRTYQTIDTFDLVSKNTISKRVFEIRMIDGAVRAAELPILVLKTQIALFSARVLAIHPMASVLISNFGPQIRIITPPIFF